MRQLEQSDGQDALRQNRADLGIAEESRFQGLGLNLSFLDAPKARTRNPEPHTLCFPLWIPGSRAAHASRNDGNQRGARLASMRCSVRRCMLSRRAVSETLRLHNSYMRWMCSQRTRSADIGLSGGSIFLFSC